MSQPPARTTLPRRYASAVCSALLFFGECCLAQCDAEWRAEFAGSGYFARVSGAALWDVDGAGPEPVKLALLGSFHVEGVNVYPSAYQRAALWDGQRFTPLDVPAGSVNAVLVHNGELIIGGKFSAGLGVSAGVIAHDGTNWRTLGLVDNASNGVFALALHEGELIAGGNFQQIGGISASCIARYDGQAWHPIGQGFTLLNTGVRAIESHQGHLYAGGVFTHSGGMPIGPLARWDGAAWQAPAPGANSAQVYSLRSHNGQLFIGGIITQLGGTPVDLVATFDGTSYANAGAGLQGAPSRPVEVLESIGGNLYAFGDGLQMSVYNGAAWSPAAPKLYRNLTSYGKVFTLKQFEGALIAFGDFDQTILPEGHFADVRGAAVLQENLWRPLARGFNERVNALKEVNGQLFAGGAMKFLNRRRIAGLAVQTPGGWEGIGTSINGSVRALTHYNGNVLVGGSFTSVDGAAAMNLAVWNGEHLTPFSYGLPVDGAIACFEHFQGQLHAGGGFLGGNGFARLSPTGWQTFAVTGGGVVDMTVHDDVLVLVGSFDNVPGLPGTYSAATFNGSAFQPMGTWAFNVTGVDVLSIQGELYGLFGTGGSSPTYTLYRWNGASWQSQGVTNGILMSSLNGKPVVHTTTGAKILEQGQWIPLGSGSFVTSFERPRTTAEFEGDIVIGGDFHYNPSANIVTPFIARYQDPQDLAILGQPAPVTTHQQSSAQFSVRLRGLRPATYQWYRNGVPITDGPLPSGAIITGSQDRTLIIANVSFAEAGDYTCAVQTTCAATASESATLAVLCYPNCDASTQPPTLNIADFSCFLTKFAAGDPYANCDQSTTAPTLNIADFSCFLTRFAAGCP